MQNPLMLINEEDNNLFIEDMNFQEFENSLNKGLYLEINTKIILNKEPLKIKKDKFSLR